MSNIADGEFYLNQALPSTLRDGHYNMTRWLLEQGAPNVNVPNAIWEKPLRTATRLGDKRIAALLREYGTTEID